MWTSLRLPKDFRWPTFSLPWSSVGEDASCCLYVQPNREHVPDSPSSVSRAAAPCQPSTSAFHTSAVVRAGLTKAKQKARAIKRDNAELKADRANAQLASHAHVVLGTRPGEETTFWANSDLAKIVLTRADVDAVAAPGTRFDFGVGERVASVEFPPLLNYGVSGAQEQQLAAVLPVLSAQAAAAVPAGRNYFPGVEQEQEQDLAREVHKANMFGRAIDLRNANAGGIAYENRRRIIAAFSAPGNPNDTGRPEVQGMPSLYYVPRRPSHRTSHQLLF